MQGYRGSWIWLVVIGGSALAATCEAAAIEKSLAVLRAVGPAGQGNVAAAAAWKDVAAADARELPKVLKALDGANPLAANWLRSAVEAIADRELQGTGKLPAPALEKFVRDTERDPRARRLAFEWLTKVDATAPDRLIPGFLNDPSTEFRRDAVQRLLDQAGKLDTSGKSDEAKQIYSSALQAARDEDQVQAAVKPLEKLGEKIDLPRHFGILTDWHLAGPFDNTGNKGFETAYPPESGVDLAAKYPGQKGEVSWSKFVTEDNYGVVDLAKAQAPHKGAATYAYTEFTSDRAQSVDIRLGSPNAWKVWVNGKLIFGRDEYHRGMKLDQYRLRAALKPGKNQILLKVCQNEQTEDWAQRWQFQLRVCDGTGTAVLSTTRPPAAPRTASAAAVQN